VKNEFEIRPQRLKEGTSLPAGKAGFTKGIQLYHFSFIGFLNLTYNHPKLNSGSEHIIFILPLFNLLKND